MHGLCIIPVLKSTKRLEVFDFFKKKDISEMTHKILSGNEYLIFTLYQDPVKIIKGFENAT